MQEAERWRSMGGDLFIVGLKQVAQDVLREGGYRSQIGENNFFLTKSEAIRTIYQGLDPEICKTCEAKIFYECKVPPQG